MRGTERRRWPWMLLALVASFLLGGWVLPHLRVEWRSDDAPSRWVAQAAPAVTPGDEPIARAAAAVSPAVVNIDTVSRVSVGFFGDRFLDEMMGTRRTLRPPAPPSPPLTHT